MEMRYWARPVGGVVAEIYANETYTPATAGFPPAFAATLIECGAEVGQLWLYDAETGVFSPPSVTPGSEAATGSMTDSDAGNGNPPKPT